MALVDVLLEHPERDAGGDPLSVIVKAARALEVALVVADARIADAPILFANRATAKIVGRAPDDLEGEALASLAGHGGVQEERAALSEFLASGAPTGASAIVLAAAGRSPGLALALASVAGPDGAAWYVMGALLEVQRPPSAADDAAMATSVGLLAQTVTAIEALMRESRQAGAAAWQGQSSGEIALDALETAQQAPSASSD